MKWRCPNCGLERSALESYLWKCPSCFSPLELVYSISADITSSRNVWERYRGFIPFIPSRGRGEGLTPLVEEAFPPHRLLFKLEYLNPSGSFKDRGTSLALYYGHAMGYRKAVVDTSGNTGISVALYSKLYQLESTIIMPVQAPPGKKRVISRIGGKVVEARDRQHANLLVEDYIKSGDTYYVAHLWSPLYIVGHATIAYEVYEECGVPDYIIAPVGSGGLILSLAYGFEKMREQGLIDRVPKLIGVQGYSSQPVYEALHGTRVEGEQSTLADGIMVSNPPRLSEIAEKIRLSGGDVVLVGNTEIEKALKELWEWGFLVEPTSASAYAAYTKSRGRIPEGSSVLIVLTGSGLKTVT